MPSFDPPADPPSATPGAGELTHLLQRWSDGDSGALDELLPHVYAELRRQAGALLRHDRAAHTLEPTGLVHDAFLRLLGTDPIPWQSRTHFFALAARAMRRVLVDHARRRDAEKRGGDRVQVGLTLAEGLGARVEPRILDILEVDRALDRLERVSARRAQVVEMRFFAGLEDKEIASVLGISLSTVEREWRTARSYLAAAFANPVPAAG